MALTGKCCEYYFESIFTAKLRQKQILYQKSELGSARGASGWGSFLPLLKLSIHMQ
jgi:hypothetical protein